MSLNFSSNISSPAHPSPLPAGEREGRFQIFLDRIYIKKGESKGTISRVLSSRSCASAGIGRMAIYLGSSLLRTSSDLTRSAFARCNCLETNSNGLFSLRLSGERNLFGLAPGGVYLAAPIAQGTGEPLPHLFTLTPTFVGAVRFLWHFPCLETLRSRVPEQSALRTTLPCGARTFLSS